MTSDRLINRFGSFSLGKKLIQTINIHTEEKITLKDWEKVFFIDVLNLQLQNNKFNNKGLCSLVKITMQIIYCLVKTLLFLNDYLV